MYCFCLASFTQHSYFEIKLYCWLLFNIEEHCIVDMKRPHFIYSITFWCTFGFFWLGAMTDCSFVLDCSLWLALRPIISLILAGEGEYGTISHIWELRKLKPRFTRDQTASSGQNSGFLTCPPAPPVQDAQHRKGNFCAMVKSTDCGIWLHGFKSQVAGGQRAAYLTSAWLSSSVNQGE